MLLYQLFYQIASHEQFMQTNAALVTSAAASITANWRVQGELAFLVRKNS
jgi:hypothetical protein